MNDDEYDLFMQELMDKGAVEVKGITEDGEFIYNFNMKVLKEVAPHIYTEIMDDLDKDLVRLYKLGLIDVTYDENLQPKFSISELGKHYAETGELPENLDF